MIRVFPFDRGRIAGHPYVAWDGGEDGEPLVVLPGLNDPLARAGEHAWFDALAASFCRRLGRACRRAGAPRAVYYVSRPAGLAPDATARSMADGYAAALDALGRVVDVLGVSMGGFLAPPLAARSRRVRSVVLALSADRLSAHGRASVRKWREWAERGEWGRVGRAGARAVARGLPRVAGRIGARAWALGGGPRAPRDFRVSADACLDHAWDGPLAVPALVVGGTRDPFFTDAAFDRAAERLGARRERLHGWGHEVLLHGAGAFDPAVAGFLRNA